MYTHRFEGVYTVSSHEESLPITIQSHRESAKVSRHAPLSCWRYLCFCAFAVRLHVDCMLRECCRSAGVLIWRFVCNRSNHIVKARDELTWLGLMPAKAFPSSALSQIIAVKRQAKKASKCLHVCRNSICPAYFLRLSARQCLCLVLLLVCSLSRARDDKQSCERIYLRRS